MRIFRKIKLRINGITPELVIPFNNHRDISEELQDLVQKGEPCFIEITELTNQRTLNQNSMYWGIVNKLARVLETSERELHMYLLRDYGTIKGVYKVVKGEMREKYYEYMGENTYKVYKGSSEMSTKEFKSLLDGAIYEAKELGLEVGLHEKYYTKN